MATLSRLPGAAACERATSAVPTEPMELQMDEKQTHAFAVTTTAMIDVLRTATVAMITIVMEKLLPEEREEVLAEIVRSTGDLPPNYSETNPAGTRFYEEVAAAAPAHAEALVRDVRKALG
jgi:hypothetical protein